MEISSLDFSKGEEMQFLSSSNTNQQNPSDQQELINIVSSNKKIQICENCEFMLETRHCSICGCPIVMMAQVGFNTCPKGLWE